MMRLYVFSIASLILNLFVTAQAADAAIKLHNAKSFDQQTPSISAPPQTTIDCNRFDENNENLKASSQVTAPMTKPTTDFSAAETSPPPQSANKPSANGILLGSSTNNTEQNNWTIT